MSEDMRFPHTVADWKMKKKMPKYWLMMSEQRFPCAVAWMLPEVVRYVLLADHRGAPPKPRMTEVGMRVYLRVKGELLLLCLICRLGEGFMDYHPG